MQKKYSNIAIIIFLYTLDINWLVNHSKLILSITKKRPV